MKLINGVSATSDIVLAKVEKSHAFKVGDMGKILDILRSKIYSKPIQTLVQEYVSNARDAVREVKGAISDITITAPQAGNAVFSVRDKGPGISESRIAEVFVQYGNTTKADTNEQTGGFGLGGKLAFAYCDTFEIITWVDGFEYRYKASIASNRNGTLDLISKKVSKAPTGTEIRVPVQADDIGEFCDAIQRVIYFWHDKPELVGLDAFESESDVIQLAKGVEMHANIPSGVGRGKGLLVCIDGIPYALSQEFIERGDSDDWNAKRPLDDLKSELNETAAIVFHIGNGLIELAASRETISENERTRKLLTPKVKAASEGLKTWLKATVDAAKDLETFIAQTKYALEYVSRSSFEFKESDEQFSLRYSNWDQVKIGLNSKNISKLKLERVGGGDNSRRRRSRYSNNGIDLNTVLFVSDESSLPHTKLLQKAARLGRSVSVLSQGEASPEFLQKLIKSLGALVTFSSSVTLPTVERAKRVIDRVDGEIKALELKESGYGDRSSTKEVSINLGDNTQKYVYIEKDAVQDIKRYASLREALQASKIDVLVVGKSVVKAVADNANFISIDAFLANPAKVLGASDYAKVVSNAANYLADGITGQLYCLESDAKARAKIRDKGLKIELDFISEQEHHYSHSFAHGDFLLSHLIETDKTVAHCERLRTTLPARLTKEYPLIRYFESFNANGEYERDAYGNVKYDAKGRAIYRKNSVTQAQYNLEIVNYLNGKFTSR